MTRDDIIRMAREAGLYVDEDGEILEGDGWHTQTLFIERFANLVAAAEREACAKVCEVLSKDRGMIDDEILKKGVLAGASMCAHAIRARVRQ